MRRHQKYAVHYKPANSERRRGAGFQFPDLSWLLNKTIFELAGLCIIIGANLWLVTQHPYFQINDITIVGLDSYSTAQARQTIDSYFKTSYFGLPRQAYIGLSVGALKNELEKTIAFDTVTIEKKFPHTLQIRATETPMKMRIHMPNGDALVSADGLLVRWYAASSTNPAPIAGPVVLTNAPGTFQGPLTPVLSEHNQSIVTTIRSRGAQLAGTRLLTVELNQDDPERIVLAYEQGTRVIITGNADIGVQLEKASVSLKKIGAGKQIDVRFADKIFVSPQGGAAVIPKAIGP